MRSNSYARYTNPGKFMKPKEWAEEAIRDGNRIRDMVAGKRVFELPFGEFIPASHVQINRPKHDRMSFDA